MANRASPPNLHKSVAISKGYNFASTWEQNAPLTEQQHEAIVSLSHAVSERPYPNNLAQDHASVKENGGLTVSTRDSSFGESQGIDAVLVNTNQFYKWFTDLESAMKSEAEEKYQHYVNNLTEHMETCDDILLQVDETLDFFNELQLQHQAVATKTKTLHDACDRLVVEKQRLIEFAEAVHSKLHYFDELENVSLITIFMLQIRMLEMRNFFHCSKGLMSAYHMSKAIHNTQNPVFICLNFDSSSLEPWA